MNKTIVFKDITDKDSTVVHGGDLAEETITITDVREIWRREVRLNTRAKTLGPNAGPGRVQSARCTFRNPDEVREFRDGLAKLLAEPTDKFKGYRTAVHVGKAKKTVAYSIKPDEITFGAAWISISRNRKLFERMIEALDSFLAQAEREL